MSAYKTYYDKLAAQGLNYFEINKRMIRIARNDQIDGIIKPHGDDIMYFESLYCGKCDAYLNHSDDYWCEITDYDCTVWYKCPKCGKYNHYIF